MNSDIEIHGVKIRDFVAEPLQVLSLGGGVQSTALLLLVKAGRLPRPDICIHADTGSEMPHTEPIIEYCRELCDELEIPFRIATATLGKLHEYYLSKGTVPIIGVRSCTMNFKVLPQRRLIREIVGNGKGKLLAECWLGITTDESKREIKSELKWIGNKFPLLRLNYSRDMCIQINEKHGLTVLKSGCFLCPYAGRHHFIKLRRYQPDLFKICIEMEEAYQNKWPNRKHGLLKTMLSLKSLEMPSLFTFGGEYVPDETNCDNDVQGGCFL